MKKLLPLLFLGISFSCSTPEIQYPDEPIDSTEYFLKFKAVCEVGPEGTFTFQVKADIFNSIVSSTSLGDCDSYFSIPDIEGTMQEGYYFGNAKQN